VRGPDAEAFVNWIVTYDVSKLKTLDAHYALFCYADGGTIDDLFIYRLPDLDVPEQDYFFLAVNASNRAKDVAWVNAHTKGFDVQVKDISDETYMLAFQGPKAPEIMNRLTASDLTKMPRFTALQETILGDVPILLGRTGYTGEDGFELFFPAQDAVRVWEKILETGKDDGVLPVGLAARDSLRFEPCMPLYGHELSADISPVEARLTFAVSFDKDFIGRDALLKKKLEKPSRVLVGFEMLDRAVARSGYTVVANEKEVGVVSTGMFSPTLKRYLGVALIARASSKIGTEIEIIIRGKSKKAKIIKRPFYLPAYRR
jgi:aminomethyltransferase